MTWSTLASNMNGACLDAFGEAVTYNPAAGGSHAITGVFDAEYQEVDPDTRAPVGSVRPALSVRNSDLPAAPKEYDQVVVSGSTYRVAVAQPDGQGMSLLLLHKVS